MPICDVRDAMGKYYSPLLRKTILEMNMDMKNLILDYYYYFGRGVYREQLPDKKNREILKHLLMSWGLTSIKEVKQLLIYVNL